MKLVKRLLARRQYKLSTLFLIVMLFGAFLVVRTRQTWEEKQVIELFIGDGARAYYETPNGCPEKLGAFESFCRFAFDGCEQRLSELYVHSEVVSDADVRRLGNLKHLRVLVLDCPRVTDVGVRYLSNLSALQELWLNGTHLTDEGLVTLTVLNNLHELHADDTLISDMGMANLAKFSALRHLSLRFTNVGDRGIKSLVSLKQLDALDLASTRVTNSSMTDIVKIPQLSWLGIEGTAVDDLGAIQLGQSRSLQVVLTGGSKIHCKEIGRSFPSGAISVLDIR